MLLELKKRDLIMDGFHPYQGEEAVAAGVSAALRPDDVVVSNHRPTGHAMARGTTPREIFAELLGRQGGPSDGIGGPMEFIDAPRNFFCGSIVGSGMTIAAGVAMVLKREGAGRIAACYFGDGASNTGSFHEALNLAAIWQLPVLYVCENNQYGEAMPVKEFVAGGAIARRADAYGLPGIQVDGMDVLAVIDAVQPAVQQVRLGGGPVLVEAITYRFKGHYGGDPEHTYRSREEVEAWRQKDPLNRLKAHLLGLGLGETQFEATDRAVREELAADQAWALAQPFVSVEEATDYVMTPLIGAEP
jgi:TPP-dependent pyruvate/acetoin dehydrogenase alpha subunit